MTVTLRGLFFCTIVSVIVLAPPARADEADDAFSQGEQAFARQEYERALSHFQRARAGGQSGAAIYYNIAVSQYRLEDYRAARQTFSELNERFPDMRPLAQYNLGLVALKLGERELAARHFRRSYYLSTDEPKLRAMSSTQLRRLIGETVPSFRWLRTFSMRGGYDDNVILQDKTGLPQDTVADSPFVEVFGTLRGPYSSRSGFRFDGGFLFLRYPDVDDFNQSALHIGGLYEWHSDDWGADFGAHLGTTTLGGDGFDRSVRFTTRLMRRLAPGTTLAVRYRHDEISAVDSVFDGVEGSRERLDLRYRRYRNGHVLSLGIARETNDRADANVSPDKTRLQADYRYRPGVGWGYGVGLELRGSDYGGISPARDEDLVQFDLTVTRHTESGWEFYARYLRADNDSNDPAFRYERNQLSVGVYRFF